MATRYEINATIYCQEKDVPAVKEVVRHFWKIDHEDLYAAADERFEAFYFDGVKSILGDPNEFLNKIVTNIYKNIGECKIQASIVYLEECPSDSFEFNKLSEVER